MRRIVSNTGPLLHLSEIGALGLLELAGPVSIPPAVAAELSRLMPGWSSARPSWISITTPEAASISQFDGWLGGGIIHVGEAHALALARQMNADWFLTDDTAARLLSRTLGLEAHGSLGVVLWAAAAGHLDETRTYALLDLLAASSLWISRRVLLDARAVIAKIFS